MQDSQEYPQSGRMRSLLSNLLVVTLGVGLIIWSFRLIQTRLTSVVSRDAVINGVLTDLKAPAEGTVSKLSVDTGQMISQGNPIITLNNERVSQLKLQEITSQLNEKQTALQRAEAKLNRQLSMVQLVSRDQQNQSHLETLAAQDAVAEVEATLQGAKARYQIAQTSYNRSKFLRTEGALAQTELDAAQRELEESKNQVGSLEARLNVMRSHQQATGLGLYLSRSSSNSDPNIRLQELQLDIGDQRNVLQNLVQSIKDAQAELFQAQADVKRQQKVVVKAPTNGVIWRLSAQPGKFVQPGESIGQILDCNRRWVDVFVDEQGVRSLQPGTPATVELYGSGSEVLQGRVSLVRSGIGRLAAGEDVAVPITPNLPRNTQVRVDLDPSTKKGNPNLFCYVGYTGRVTFKVR